MKFKLRKGNYNGGNIWFLLMWFVFVFSFILTSKIHFEFSILGILISILGLQYSLNKTFPQKNESK